MWPFHRHNWQVILKTYTPQFKGTIPWEWPHYYQIKMFTGFTIALLKCQCGGIKTVEVLGEEVKGSMEIKFKEIPK